MRRWTLEPLGSLGDAAPCLARKRVGAGMVFYSGTNLGQAAERSAAGLHAMLDLAAAAAGVERIGHLRPDLPGTVHLDILSEEGTPRFAVLASGAQRDQTVHIVGSGRWQGLYRGVVWDLDGESSVRVPAGFTELFALDPLSST